jgi:hypothetical protein
MKVLTHDNILNTHFYITEKKKETLKRRNKKNNKSMKEKRTRTYGT